jgi:hypothetical protein
VLFSILRIYLNVNYARIAFALTSTQNLTLKMSKGDVNANKGHSLYHRRRRVSGVCRG